MIIYIDMIWLLNFIVDTILLFLTAFILKRRWKLYRIIFGALLGSSIVLFAISPNAELMTHPVMKMLLSICIILTSFGYIKLHLFLKTLGIFYFATFVVGGGIVGLHYFFQSSFILEDGKIMSISTGFGDPISWGFVCVMIPIMIYFSKKQIDHIEIRKIKFDEMISVEIQLENRNIVVNGFVDSGNSLCDPLTQKPVMILDISKNSNFIPDWIYNKSKRDDNFVFSKEEQKLPYFDRIRLIPYQVVGRKNQILIALKPDYIKLTLSSNEVIFSNALLGLSHTNLSTENEFDCLLNPKMLQKSSMFSA